MKAIVTGGAGFIGSHIVDGLLSNGYEVMALDDISTGREENLRDAQQHYRNAFKLSKVDIRLEEASTIIKTFKPDVIFHMAAQMNVRRSVAEPVFDASINVVGFVNVLESARLAGVPKVVMASTGGAIYGEQEYFPADEEHPIHAECQYGVAKRCGELYLDYYSRAYKMSCTALRFANVFGPRQNPKGEAGVVAIFADRLIAGDTLRINGDGGQTRDFVYVADVVRANLMAAGSVKPGVFDIYNVGTGKETSINTLAEGCIAAWVKIHTGLNASSIVVEHGQGLPGEQRRSVIDTTRINKAFGWTPTVGLEDGLGITIKSFKDAV